MNDTRVLRLWGRVLIVLGVGTVLFGLTAAYVVATEGTHGHHGAGEKPCPTSVIPIEFRQENPDIKCVVGSPQNFRQDISKLEHGLRRDSELWIKNRSANGVPAMAKGKGCGRVWTTVDRSTGLFGAQRRDTGCNLGGHITCHLKRPTSEKWVCANKYNRHPG